MFIKKIIAEMPPHDTYIEMHLGGGAVMLRKLPALHNWGIDIDPETVEALIRATLIFWIDWRTPCLLMLAMPSSSCVVSITSLPAAS
ncbi:TPA: hypothetical protein ACQ2HU_003949 [Klebsiella pneumoniae]